jgi:hypothetical protein
MWIQFNNAFLSIVENREKTIELLVRARVKGDIERVFPEADVFEDNNADYKYRAFISKAKVAERMVLKVTEINYDNFKNSVKEIDRKKIYSNIWAELRKIQK